jgi:hypothetical protein
MTIHLGDRERLLLSSTTSAAAAQAQSRVVERAAVAGRAGILADLRQRAEVLAVSPLALDQIKAAACRAAADDIARGRSPLTDWRLFQGDEPPTAQVRQAVRSSLPTVTAAASRVADEAASRAESDILASADCAFTGTWRLPHQLENVAALQRILWDDPRLCVEPELRVTMGETLVALERRLKDLQGGIRAEPGCQRA